MNYTLVKASPADKEVLTNLMQFYFYDFSEYLKYDVEANGSFVPYPDLEAYLKSENDKVSYLIMNETKYVGFVFVKHTHVGTRKYFSIAEFFILKKYRREGIGKAVAIDIFNLYPGGWEVYQRETNKPAQLFWNKTIHEYTKGQFTERFENGRFIQRFKN